MFIPPFRGSIDCSARPWTAQVQRKEIYHTLEKFSMQGGEPNRIQIFKIFKRRSLSVAAEILFDGRTRLCKLDLAVPA